MGDFDARARAWLDKQEIHHLADCHTGNRGDCSCVAILSALLSSVAQEERERCAGVAKGFQLDVPFSMQCNCHATTARDIAAAIREGG